jgi:hypothetical protein
MIVDEKVLEKLKYTYCNLCGRPFELGQSHEKITTHRKSKLIVHTDCVKKGM